MAASARTWSPRCGPRSSYGISLDRNRLPTCGYVSSESGHVSPPMPLSDLPRGDEHAERSHKVVGSGTSSVAQSRRAKNAANRADDVGEYKSFCSFLFIDLRSFAGPCDTVVVVPILITRL
jgi:hypothetical protein